MLNNPQIERMLAKIDRFSAILEPMIFEKVGEVDFKAFVTDKQYHSIPDDSNFSEMKKGDTWYGENKYCWFKGSYTVDEAFDSQPIYIKPKMQGYEAMLWVDGKVFGTFATKITYTAHGNHYCDLVSMNPKAGQKFDLAIEWYGGHYMPGTQPNEDTPIKDFNYKYDGADICVKNYEIQDYYFDLISVYQLAKYLPEDSFMRGKAVNALFEVHKKVHYFPFDCGHETFMQGIRASAPDLKAVLSLKAGETDAESYVIGHSHMDTAWLWHVGETVKKCARTYANQLSLMEQYPEYKFIQSSACHSNFLRVNYPELFERIQKAVAEGRYEPNGGVWVECDCNITSGESMVRQFLWGQRFTRKYFAFTSNCFWLPDTFGYSAAIPQIMKGCGVDYFLTTKISWNDTNKFPYDTFYWQGIDGTKVFSHFNRTHLFPEVMDIIEATKGQICQKSVNNKRLIAYGYGDGGGGPQYEMIEFARRAESLSEVGTVKNTTVGDFMKDLEATSVNPNTYRGELYLELHRGTLTNQHTIKRNNRKSELALRDLEIITVNDAVSSGSIASEEKVNPLYETLLINQFHDILPGTCLNRAHVESRAQTTELISKARAYIAESVSKNKKDGVITLTNTLSFDRNDPVFIDYKNGYIVDGDYKQQIYTDLDGNKKLIVSGVTVPAMSSVTLKLKKGEISGKSAFRRVDSSLETPFAKVEFAPNGTISSFIDKRENREIRGEGFNFNTLIMAEDVPSAWDNWDIDADLEPKFEDVSNLVSSEIVSDGESAYIIRNEYKISSKSTVKQDMIFFADSAEVRFDTIMDWQDDHRFLKTAFDTNVCDDYARFEIQFGNVKRPTTRNDSVEQAKFELVNHKYTDLSETRFGVSILNDCKYGISVNGGQMRLSLHKGGTRPDYKGDHDGLHRAVYSFRPHDGGFSAENVIRPAYELNVPVIESESEYSLNKLISIDAPNVIVETVKPCEDAEKAYIVRMYEAEGSAVNANVTVLNSAKKTEITNMLEETQSVLPDAVSNVLSFKPFEIKTIKVTY